jgi:hypothetical protein
MERNLLEVFGQRTLHAYESVGAANGVVGRYLDFYNADDRTPRWVIELLARHTSPNKPYRTQPERDSGNPLATSRWQYRMTLHVEVLAPESLRAERIVVSIGDVTKLRGEVAFHRSGALPNDGKVIDDCRN